ncbi:YibE/F family protein, partial [Staphylococcus saprophyticus]|uniref:YibE/F family protein n=1 Tax=Staphylococcus saprophyticus TaxID=29385 RepID=UPI0021B37C6E
MGILISRRLRVVVVRGWEWGTVMSIMRTLVGRLLWVGIREWMIEISDGCGLKLESMSFVRLGGKEVLLGCVMIGLLGAVMDVGIRTV